MKKLLIISLCFLLVIPVVQASGLKASMSWCTFLSPADGPYVETYLSVWSKSIQFDKLPNGNFQGRVGITLIFKQGNDIREYKKYELKSPEIKDTLQRDFSFIDQQRVLLPEGKYVLEFQLSDLNKGNGPVQSADEITISFPADKITLSDIQLLEKFTKTENQNILTKSGYDLIPYPDNFLPKTATKIGFYAEIYNADKLFGPDSKYLLSYFIQSYETGKSLTDFIKVRKETSKPVTSVLHEFDIQKLPSGNYKIVIEVRNQKNEVVAGNDLFFQRSNPDMQFEIKDIDALDVQGTFVEIMTNRDSLIEYIKCLYPISTEMEKLFAGNKLRSQELRALQQYFLSFWQTRDPIHPENSWLTYKDAVERVNGYYRTSIRKGYETDRGRIYLMYGVPNSIVDQVFDNSALYMSADGNTSRGASELPYQIWHYYEFPGHQRNIKFVFANPNLASNDFPLIHSNAQGEINNPNWQAELMRGIGIFDKDNISPNGKFGDKSGDLYNNPK